MSDLPPGCPLELVRCSPPLKSTLPKRRKILLDTRWPDWTSLWLPLAFLRRWTNIRLYFWSFKSRSQAFKAVIPQNIWTKKMSCRQFLERGCPQPSGSPPFPGSASIRQVISSTQDNTLPHTEAKATFFSGTYQCSVLRRCDPVPKAKETLEDDPVAITKSLYMKVTIATLILVLSDNTKTFKPGVRFSWWPTRSGRRQKIWLHDRIENMFPTQVYEYPDYQPDLVVVISAFGVTFVILLVGDLKSNRIWKKDILRHQVSVTIERTASGGSSHQWKLCRFSKDVALLFGII